MNLLKATPRSLFLIVRITWREFPEAVLNFYDIYRNILRAFEGLYMWTCYLVSRDAQSTNRAACVPQLCRVLYNSCAECDIASGMLHSINDIQQNYVNDNDFNLITLMKSLMPHSECNNS